MGLPWGLSIKESTHQFRGLGLDPWVRKIPWRRKWQPTLVSFPEKSYGQRSLLPTVHGITKSLRYFIHQLMDTGAVPQILNCASLFQRTSLICGGRLIMLDWISLHCFCLLAGVSHSSSFTLVCTLLGLMGCCSFHYKLEELGIISVRAHQGFPTANTGPCTQ